MAHVSADRVRDTTTTTGTGVVTVSASAPTGYRTFSAVCSTNDTFYYCIAHQTASEWEVGQGKYSATNQITRSLVIASSNSDAAVNFSAGTKDVFITLAAKRTDLRETLFADRSYYVRTDGSDSNNGLANTSAGAFLTISKAITTVIGLNANGYNVTINVGAGTYTEALTLAPIVGANSTASIRIVGDTTTPANVTITTSGAQTVYAGACGGAWYIRGVKLVNTGGGPLITVAGGTYITLGENNYGTTTGTHIFCYQNATVYCATNYTISGGAGVHWETSTSGMIFASGLTITLTGTPAFSFFAAGSTGGMVRAISNTFSGSATGTRFVYGTGAGIYTNSPSTINSYLPGNANGSLDAATYGFYG